MRFLKLSLNSFDRFCTSIFNLQASLVFNALVVLDALCPHFIRALDSKSHPAVNHKLRWHAAMICNHCECLSKTATDYDYDVFVSGSSGHRLS